MTSGEIPARSTTGLLLDRTFAPFFWGNTAATLAAWAYNITAVVVVFQLTGSPRQVGLVTIVQFSVPLVLAPVGGALADRFDRRRLIVAAQGMSAAAVGALAVLTLAVGDGRLPSVWPVLSTSFLLGLGTAVADPARHALVPSLVPPADMNQAIALNAVTFNVGRAVGPGLAGLLLVTAGPGAAFGLSAVGNLTLGLALLLVRPRAAEPISATDRGMGAGLRYVLADRRQLALLVGVAVAGIASDPVITLTPLLAERLLIGGGPTWGISSEELAVGVMASAFGAGAVLTITVLRALHGRTGYRRIGLRGLALQAVTLTALAASPNLAIATAVLLLSGIGYFLALTSLTTLLQVEVPGHVRGRLMALWGMFFLGSRPVAAFVDSTLADAFSPEVALLTVAAVVAFSGVVIGRATSSLGAVGPCLDARSCGIVDTAGASAGRATEEAATQGLRKLRDDDE